MRTFAEVLAARSAERPDDPAYVFLGDGLNESDRLTYRGLHERARRIAAALAPGARVLLLLPPGLDYIAAIFGCFEAGAVPGGAPPPTATRLDRVLPRLEAIAADAEVSVIVTDDAVRAFAEPHFKGEAEWIGPDSLPDAPVGTPGPEGVAFLQYTSGSTAAPRGVMLTHENLLTNCRSLISAFGTGPHSSVYSWLPPYHDMGLIGGLLHPMLAGVPCYTTSPVTILRRPMRWLEAVSRHRVTFSGGPNFMYDLCVRRAKDVDGLDLSCWEKAVNGAEPVRAATWRAFLEAFGPYGLREEALTAAYGMAETTLLLTAADGLTITSFDRDALAGGKAVPGAGAELVSCGGTDADHRIRIVDPETGRPCTDGTCGEVWASGPSVAVGYWRGERFGERIPTGDLGFVHEGGLYLTGRSKEVLIINGVKHHPHDLESLAETGEDLLRPHCSAAFQTEGGSVALVAEVARGHEADDLSFVLAGIRERVSAGAGVRVDAVVLVPARSVPKTTSGKIQRLLTRERLLAGELKTIARQGEAA